MGESWLKQSWGHWGDPRSTNEPRDLFRGLIKASGILRRALLVEDSRVSETGLIGKIVDFFYLAQYAATKTLNSLGGYLGLSGSLHSLYLGEFHNKSLFSSHSAFAITSTFQSRNETADSYRFCKRCLPSHNLNDKESLSFQVVAFVGRMFSQMTKWLEQQETTN